MLLGILIISELIVCKEIRKGGDKDSNQYYCQFSSSCALSFLYRHIADCSHWVQQDAPEEINQFMREFLQE